MGEKIKRKDKILIDIIDKIPTVLFIELYLIKPQNNYNRVSTNVSIRKIDNTIPKTQNVLSMEEFKKLYFN